MRVGSALVAAGLFGLGLVCLGSSDVVAEPGEGLRAVGGMVVAVNTTELPAVIVIQAAGKKPDFLLGVAVAAGAVVWWRSRHVCAESGK